MKRFAKLFVSICAGVAMGYVALSLELSGGWVIALYLGVSLGLSLALGVCDVEEPKCRHMTIAEGLRWRTAA